MTAQAWEPNQVQVTVTSTTGTNNSAFYSRHFQVCPRRGDGTYKTWMQGFINKPGAPQDKTFMDLKIWIQARAINGVTESQEWSTVKSKHLRTPSIGEGHRDRKTLNLSLDLGAHVEYQGQEVRQKFRIRWKHSRTGPDEVLFGGDGYSRSCSLPIEGGGLVPGAPVPQNNSGGG